MKISIVTTFNVTVTNNAGDKVLQVQADNYQFEADANGLIELVPEVFAAFVAAKKAVCEMDKATDGPVRAEDVTPRAWPYRREPEAVS